MENKKVIQQFYELSYNQKNYEAAGELVAPSFFDHSPASSKSREDALEAIKAVHRAFPDLQVEIIDLIEEENTIVVLGVFEGTQAAPYLETQNTGNKVRFFAIEIYRFNKLGKIIESWGYWPDQTIIEQLTKKD